MSSIESSWAGFIFSLLFYFANTIAPDGVGFRFSCRTQWRFQSQGMWRSSHQYFTILHPCNIEVEKKVWDQWATVCKVKVPEEDGRSKHQGWSTWRSQVQHEALCPRREAGAYYWAWNSAPASHEPPTSYAQFQVYKKLQGVLLFTEGWRQAWARSFIVGVILGHRLQWFSKEFRRYPDKSNLFLHQFWYWLCPSGTKGSRLCSLPALALPKAKRGDESQTQQKPWVEGTSELSIILTLTSSTQPVSPGPLPHLSSSGATFREQWGGGLPILPWEEDSADWSSFPSALQKSLQLISLPFPGQTSLQSLQVSTCCHSTYRCSKNQLSSGIFCTMEAGSHVVSFWFHPLLRCETFCQLLSLSEPTVRHGPTGSPCNVALRIKYEHVCVVPKCLLRLDVWPSSIIPINCF